MSDRNLDVGQAPRHDTMASAAPPPACAAEWALSCCAATRRFRLAEDEVRSSVDRLIDRCNRFDGQHSEAITGARHWLTQSVRELRRATTAVARTRPCEALKADER